MRLVVLGGGRFIGRALVEEAVARGWSVTCVTRGNHPVHALAAHVRLDRDTADNRTLASIAPSGDAVIDTWGGDSSAVAAAASALAGSVGGYCYVSTRSIYREWRADADEAAPSVPVDDTGTDDYAVRKRRAELAVLERFPHSHVILRPGIVLGPRENQGRMAWWRAVMRDPGVRVLPGPPDLPVQIIDVRDLAAFALDQLAAGVTGVFDVAAPPVTLGELDRTFAALTGSTARTVWADVDCLQRLGFQPWTSFPLWVPRSHSSFGFFTARCARARRYGLSTRTLRETLAACLTDSALAEHASRPWAPDNRARAWLVTAVTSAERRDGSRP